MADLNETFQPAMAYVILSRITSISQLFLKPFDPAKIYCNEIAKIEAQRLKRIAINKNQTEWDMNENNTVKISCLNVQSLGKHHEDVEKDEHLKKSQILFLSETWLTSDFEGKFANFSYQYSLNRGSKGIIALSKIKPSNVTKIENDFCSVIVISYEHFEIITVYRFAERRNLTEFSETILRLVNQSKTVVIMGDINIDVISEPNNMFTTSLERNGFSLKLRKPTHILGGCIDHFYLREVSNISVKCTTTIHPIYYSDHDALCSILKFV